MAFWTIVTFQENISHQRFLKVRRWGRWASAEERRRWPQHSRIGPLPRSSASSEIILFIIFCRKKIWEIHTAGRHHLKTNRIIQSDQLDLVVVRSWCSDQNSGLRGCFSETDLLRALLCCSDQLGTGGEQLLPPPWEQIAGIPWLQKGRLGNLIEISFKLYSSRSSTLSV